MLKGLIKVVVFFSLIYFFFGTKTTQIGIIVYLCLPFIILNGTARRCLLFMHKVRTPFLNLKNVGSFGIVGGRSFTIKNHSTIDEQEVELRVWHILPHSLIDKLDSLEDDPEERNSYFEDQLKYARKPVIVYSHGITQTVGEPSRVALYKQLQKLDVHVITFDYRGYGDSTDIMPKRMSIVEDFLTVYSWVNKRCGDSPVFVWGHSLVAGIQPDL
ncbi:hypothetical protein evm_005385 [Chilo suppressalis]|nr:hypothetical protein evm_005385 [Chilo suppressalis]